MKQLAPWHQRIIERDRTMAMHRAFSERDDHARLAKHRLARSLLEARLMIQFRKIVLVRQLRRNVMLEGPGNSQFERASCIEAGRARVRVTSGFSIAGGLE